MHWNLRYASHIGYRSWERPLFREIVGSLDPDEHIRFAAELGLAGVQDLWAVERPVEDQRAIGRTMEKFGIEGGCIFYTRRENVRAPFWASSGRDARANLESELQTSIETAQRTHSCGIVLLSGTLPDVPVPLQFATMIENVRWAADIAGKAGVTLFLESMSFRSHPHMLLSHTAETYAAAKAIKHPAVKLIYDTSHVQIMDGDLLANLDAIWDEVGLVQLADNPGRLEPGTGEINFATILRALKARNYTGLVELEHNWSEQTRDCEQRGIDTLHRMDSELSG